MRRRVRDDYHLKAFFDGRVHQLRFGRDFPPFVDLGRLRVVPAFRLETGTMHAADWQDARRSPRFSRVRLALAGRGGDPRHPS